VYYVHRLIEKHGRKGNIMKWREQLNGDCEARCTQPARTLRLDMPRSAEGALMDAGRLSF
jgi:hypothetical protein